VYRFLPLRIGNYNCRQSGVIIVVNHGSLLIPQDFYLLIKKGTLHGTNCEVHMDPHCDTSTGGNRCGKKYARYKRAKEMNIRGLAKSFLAECWVGGEYQSSEIGMPQTSGHLLFTVSSGGMGLESST